MQGGENMTYYVGGKKGANIIKKEIILSELICDIFKDTQKTIGLSDRKMGRIWNEAKALGKNTRERSVSVSDMMKI